MKKRERSDDLNAGLNALKQEIRRNWRAKFEKSINTLHPSLDATPPARKRDFFMDGLFNLQEELSTTVSEAVEEYFLIATANRRLVGHDLAGWIRRQTGDIPKEISQESTRWVLSVCSGRQSFAFAWLRTSWLAPKWLRPLFLIGHLDQPPSRNRELIGKHRASQTEEVLSMIQHAAFGVRLAKAREDALQKIPIWIAQSTNPTKRAFQGSMGQRARQRSSMDSSTQLDVRQPYSLGTISAGDHWHTEDYSSVFFADGEEESLKDRQAAVIKFLHKQMNQGIRSVPKPRILAHIGSFPNIRMGDIFRDTRVWKTLLVSARKGRYRLNLEAVMAPRPPVKK